MSTLNSEALKDQSILYMNTLFPVFYVTCTYAAVNNTSPVLFLHVIHITKLSGSSPQAPRCK